MQNSPFASIRREYLGEEPAAPAPAPSPPPPELPSDDHTGLVDAVGELHAMPAPEDAQRWPQVLDDATRLIVTWRARLHDRGWSLGDIFGLDLAGGPGSRHADEIGLVFVIRGGRVLDVDAERAVISDEGRVGYRYHRRRESSPQPIWLNRRKDRDR